MRRRGPRSAIRQFLCSRLKVISKIANDLRRLTRDIRGLMAGLSEWGCEGRYIGVPTHIKPSGVYCPRRKVNGAAAGLYSEISC